MSLQLDNRPAARDAFQKSLEIKQRLGDDDQTEPWPRRTWPMALEDLATWKWRAKIFQRQALVRPGRRDL